MSLLASTKKYFTKLKNRESIYRILIAVVTYLLLAGSTLYGNVPSGGKFEVDKPSPWDIKASGTLKVVDEEETQKAKIVAAEQIPEIESYQPASLKVAQERITSTFKCIRDLLDLQKKQQTEAFKRTASSSKKTQSPTVKKDAAVSPSSARATPAPKTVQTENGAADEAALNEQEAVKDNIPISLKSTTIEALIKFNRHDLAALEKQSMDVLEQVMSEGVREGHLTEARQRVAELTDEYIGLEHDTRLLIKEIVGQSLVANRIIDKTATIKARADAQERVEPIMRTILPGEMVIREGDIVTQSDIPILEAMGVYTPRISPQGAFSYGVLILICMLIVAVYMRNFSPQIYYDNLKLVGLIGLCLVFIYSSKYLSGISFYLAPIAFPALLITILLDGRLAGVIIVMLALYINVITQSLPASAACLLTGLTATTSAHHISKRWDLVFATIMVWGTNVISVLIFSVLMREEWNNILVDSLFFGGLSAIVSSLMAAGALPILEKALKITTHMRLLELCSPTEPILNKLLTQAPGTYQHSIMVANLAEAAAQAIGADAQLCRAGAYYHDIGKISQPGMFVENQGGNINPHDNMPPRLSASIIISHVSYGLVLAQQYKLPDALVNFIAEHHGTSLASFFYSKALKAETDGNPVFEEEFRYPGPRPRSKETAIVMICDGMEAASRTLKTPTRENIAQLADKLIGGIQTRGQLEDCALSFKDVNIVKEVVISTLTSHYHSRVVYPDSSPKGKASPK